ncbi:MAG: lipopolysaccharide biosynthesis protein [Hyphomicrobiaceae bacterium]
MLRRLVQNTMISAVAFGIAGVLGLIAVAVIARSYGFAALGMIVLVRNLLPTGFLALIDFGVADTTTQSVARARGGGNWVAAGERVTLLLIGSVVIGIASAILLWSAAFWLAQLFRVADDQQAAFIGMTRATAAVLLVAFPGLIAEGLLKGFERYGWLRLVEIAGSFSYVAAVLLIAAWQMPYQWIAYAFLIVTAVRCILLGLVASRLARGSPLRLQKWGEESRADVALRSGLMFNNRVVGILQQQLPPMAIGALLGAGPVGIYDILTRLPRFLKSTLGLISSAILPTSARIDETSDTVRQHMLGRGGFVLPAAMALPALGVVAMFSKDILSLWVGPTFAAYWPWLALMMVVPAVGVLIGPGQVALYVRSDFMRLTTRLLMLQAVLQYLLTFAFFAWFSERAFIIGQAVSMTVFAPILANNMLKTWGLPPSLFWSQVGRHAVVLLAVAGWAAVIQAAFAPFNLLGLGAVMAGCCVLAWLGCYLVVLGGQDRAVLKRAIEVAGKG